MNYSYQELKQEYSKLKKEQQADREALDEWLKNHPWDNSTPPQRDDIVLCSRNMAHLYLSARLSLHDETFSEKFKIHLFIVEAYAKKVFRCQSSVYLFLQVALCGMAPSVKHYINLFMPDFIMDAKTNESEVFTYYVMKISYRLLRTDYKWYGKILIESTVNAFQSEKYFLSANQEEAIFRLTEELKKYSND